MHFHAGFARRDPKFCRFASRLVNLTEFPSPTRRPVCSCHAPDGMDGADAAVMTMTHWDDDMDDDGDGIRWMTYAELGRARGISTASATRLAFRRKWRRQAGNEGTARVAVPVSEARPPTDRQRGDRDVVRGDIRDDASHSVRALEAAVAALREQLEQANAAIAAERSRADRAEQGREGERARADALRDRLNAMQEQLADALAALQAAEAAGARADRAERDKERAEQIRDGEHARADAAAARADAADADRRAAQVRADAAEGRAQRAEDRTTELRDRLDATQAELAAARESEDRARAQAHAAQDEAAALRQAADVQRALGRWARLRLAWRGG